MHTKFIMPVIDTECPKEMNEKNCPLRKFLDKNKLFKIKGNVLTPVAELYRLSRAEYVQCIESMNQACNKCQRGN